MGPVERVVVLPEVALRGGRLARLGSRFRHRVLLRDRQVTVDEDDAVAEGLSDAPNGRLSRPAERTLEVSEHHELEWSASLAKHVIHLAERRRELARPGIALRS